MRQQDVSILLSHLKGLKIVFYFMVFVNNFDFLEFHQYLTSDNHANKEKLLSEGIERMNLSTWQYAKYQQKWIKKRIVNRKF